MQENTCCFFGHRDINKSEDLREKLTDTIEKLVTAEKTDTFLFGSKGNFDDLCYDIVTELKEKYPHIKRIYVRAEYPIINDEYMAYLLKLYEDTYYPEKIVGSGKAVYIERNCEMINKSKYCIVYYDKQNSHTTRKSGTKIALDNATKKGREIIIFSPIFSFE